MRSIGVQAHESEARRLNGFRIRTTAFDWPRSRFAVRRAIIPVWSRFSTEGDALQPGTYARFETTEGNFTDPAVRQGSPEDRRQLRRPRRGHEGVDATRRPGRSGTEPVLRRRHLPPRHQRLHDPGGRSARPGHRRAGLQVRRRVPSVAAPQHAPASSRWPTPGRTPTAASSSSRSGRRRTSTTATRCSARSSRGSTSCKKIGAVPTGRQDRPVTPVVMNKVTIERVA